MSEIKLKSPPTKMPETFRQYYEVIANPDPYEGEPEDSYLERKQLLETFQAELIREGLTIDDLAMAEMGLRPNSASPLLASLMGRLQ